MNDRPHWFMRRHLYVWISRTYTRRFECVLGRKCDRHRVQSISQKKNYLIGWLVQKCHCCTSHKPNLKQGRRNSKIIPNIHYSDHSCMCVIVVIFMKALLTQNYKQKMLVKMSNSLKNVGFQLLPYFFIGVIRDYLVWCYFYLFL